MAICAVCMGEFRTITLNERVCAGCLADAKLGRLVAAMKCGHMLHFRWTSEMKAGWSIEEWWKGEPRSIASGDTPEKALEKAMGEEK